MSVHFSSKHHEWETPPEIFDPLHKEFGFELDVCATPSNAKCSRYFTLKENGLSQSWSGTCWMNPPYGREVGKWIEKAYNEAQKGALVVCLLPARTDTRWWHDHVMKAEEIRYLRGRIKFVGAAHSAPFPSAIVIFGRKYHE